MEETEGYRRALGLLRAVTGPQGFTAGVEQAANVASVSTRDGVVCGLAALVSGDEELIRVFQRTLTTLRKHQGPHGEVPGNVGDGGKVTYGTLAGLADTPLWYVVGVCALGRTDPSVLDEHEEAVSRALWVTEAWEYNARGLVYVPLGGSWADEYVLHGYLLTQQALGLWAWRAAAMAYNENTFHAKATKLESLLREEFWLRPDGRPTYHPMAYATALEQRGPSRFWAAAFHPGGYDELFDGLANGLALMVGLGRGAEVADHVRALLASLGTDLVPAYDPPITPGSHRWDALNEYKFNGFRNRPGDCHNGGLWPLVTGFVAAGAAAAGERELARRLADGIDRANANDNWAFAEYHRAGDRRPRGARGSAWSAAAAVIARHAVAGRIPVALTDTRQAPLVQRSPKAAVPAPDSRSTGRQPDAWFPGSSTPPPGRRSQRSAGRPQTPPPRPESWSPAPGTPVTGRTGGSMTTAPGSRPGAPSGPPQRTQPPASPHSRPVRPPPQPDDGWGPASGPPLMNSSADVQRGHPAVRRAPVAPLERRPSGPLLDGDRSGLSTARIR